MARQVMAIKNPLSAEQKGVKDERREKEESVSEACDNPVWCRCGQRKARMKSVGVVLSAC